MKALPLVVKGLRSRLKFFLKYVKYQGQGYYVNEIRMAVGNKLENDFLARRDESGELLS